MLAVLFGVVSCVVGCGCYCDIGDVECCGYVVVVCGLKRNYLSAVMVPRVSGRSAQADIHGWAFEPGQGR